MPDSPQLARARAIAAAETFDDVYAASKARYVLDPAGVLGSLESDVYDVVFSMDVLEHIQANDLPAAIAGQYRALMPGGIAVHEVGVDGHLTHYDRKASLKQYLSYS